MIATAGAAVTVEEAVTAIVADRADATVEASALPIGVSPANSQGRGSRYGNHPGRPRTAIANGDFRHYRIHHPWWDDPNRKS